MIETQLRDRDILDEAVLAAMERVPRELFVPEPERGRAYDDAALPLAHGQTISQPYMVGRIAEALATRPGELVLDVGTGSGYQAAVLARLGAKVTSIERLPDLAEAARERLRELAIDGVDVRVGDGSTGDPEGAPWDGIVVTAGAPSIPDALREQLGVGARLVIPVGPRYQQDLIVVERRGPADWQEWSDGAVVFVPLVGEGGWGAQD